MGDRSYVSLWIYQVPERTAEDVLEVLNDYGFTTYGNGPLTVTMLLETVDNEDNFFIEEASLNTAGEVSEKLEDLGVAHQSHQDPKYEYSGDIHRFHPNLGRWDGNATAEAETFVTDWQLRYWMNSTNNPTELLDRIKYQLGIDFEDKFREETGQKSLGGRPL